MEKALEGSSLDPVPSVLDQAIAAHWKDQRPSDDVIRFSLRLKSPRALAAARPLVGDSKTPKSQRLDLLKALAELQDAESEPLFLALFRDEKEEAEIRLAALSALRRYSGEEIPAAVLKLYPALKDDLRQTAQALLAGRPTWALRLLRSVDRGTIPAASIAVDSLLLMQSYEHQETIDLIAKHWPNLRQSSEAKAKRISDIVTLLSDKKKNGNAKRGREIFTNSCAICHKFGDQGRDIGPDLTGYEMDNLEFLIPAVVDPNLGVREGFELATLTLRAANDAAPAILTGFITDADERTVTLKDLSGNQTVIARTTLANEVRAPISVMPEGLLDALNEQQIRDLVAYLQKQ